MAMVDYFLKIDGIKGESTKEGHKDEIEIESFSWGATQTGTASHGGGMGAGKVAYNDFAFTMRTQKCSPDLMLACSSGQHIKNAIFTARKAGKVQQDYLKVTFTDVMVSSFQTGGSGADIVPLESISLNFTKVEFEYKEQKPDGSLGGAVKKWYDLKLTKGG